LERRRSSHAIGQGVGRIGGDQEEGALRRASGEAKDGGYCTGGLAHSTFAAKKQEL